MGKYSFGPNKIIQVEKCVMMCTLGCKNFEDQRHIFEKCSALNTKHEQIMLNFIFKDSTRKKEAIQKILRIEQERIKLKGALEYHPAEAQQMLYI